MIEIFAWILVLLVVIKLTFLFFDTGKWLKVIKFLYSKPKILFTVEFVLAVAAFYFLIQQLTMIQILAVIMLGALLTGMSFAVYGKELISWAQGIFKKKDFLKRAWFVILIWLVLIIWGLLSLLKLV